MRIEILTDSTVPYVHSPLSTHHSLAMGEEYYRRADLSCSRAQQITSCTELVLSEFPASSR